LTAATIVALVLTGPAALAQCPCSGAGYAAPVAYGAAYAPAAYAYSLPYATYYTPAPAVAYVPSVPYATYYRPYAAAYVPYAAYYAPAPVYYRPYVRPGVSMYGTPKVYVSGEPVRNAIRAVTP
jgi:hypothetical protein